MFIPPEVPDPSAAERWLCPSSPLVPPITAFAFDMQVLFFLFFAQVEFVQKTFCIDSRKLLLPELSASSQTAGTPVKQHQA